MRTDTNGSSESSRFELAQRVALWLRGIRKLKQGVIRLVTFRRT
jgi:hypothetical protein